MKKLLIFTSGRQAILEGCSVESRSTTDGEVEKVEVEIDLEKMTPAERESLMEGRRQVEIVRDGKGKPQSIKVGDRQLNV